MPHRAKLTAPAPAASTPRMEIAATRFQSPLYARITDAFTDDWREYPRKVAERLGLPNTHECVLRLDNSTIHGRRQPKAAICLASISGIRTCCIKRHKPNILVQSKGLIGNPLRPLPANILSDERRDLDFTSSRFPERPLCDFGPHRRGQSETQDVDFAMQWLAKTDQDRAATRTPSGLHCTASAAYHPGIEPQKIRAQLD